MFWPVFCFPQALSGLEKPTGVRSGEAAGRVPRAGLPGRRLAPLPAWQWRRYLLSHPRAAVLDG